MSDYDWFVDVAKLLGDKIEILGFSYEPKILHGIPKNDPSLTYGGNPH